MTIYQVWKKKKKKSSKALLYVWPYNLLEKSKIFAFVQEHVLLFRLEISGNGVWP